MEELSKLFQIREAVKAIEDTEPKDKCKNFFKIMRTIAVTLELLEELTQKVNEMENKLNNLKN